MRNVLRTNSSGLFTFSHRERKIMHFFTPEIEFHQCCTVLCPWVGTKEGKKPIDLLLSRSLHANHHIEAGTASRLKYIPTFNFHCSRVTAAQFRRTFHPEKIQHAVVMSFFLSFCLSVFLSLSTTFIQWSMQCHVRSNMTVIRARYTFVFTGLSGQLQQHEYSVRIYS